ncbi:MAG: ATP-binding protein [Pseudomonas sp.]|uniref:ATP-binding protein n=1 Tax=Pseudomonas sp. TaxID=306 RepID=UPI003D0EE5A7
MSADAASVICFGNCELAPRQRLFKVNGSPVELRGRAFDVLVALVEANGQVVSKDELMRNVWAGRIVEENTLEAQISLLRKALGSERHLLKTVSGRGYQLTGHLVEIPVVEQRLTHGGLPSGISALVGRESALAELSAHLRDHRLLTLVGPGGIGKTRLAVECARELSRHFRDQVHIADLAPLFTDEFLLATIAKDLGLAPAGNEATLEQIAAYVGSRRILFILDNCEHLIDAVAQVADTLLHRCPGLHILATSQEPLRIEDEYVYRVAPLEVPQPGDAPEIIRAASAVQLLEARLVHGWSEVLEEPLMSDLKARICRELDGIPLAIELAAARVATLGLAAVATRLDDRMALLKGGNRSALPRHQTLRATLDWSFDLLSPTDQIVFRRLAVFAGAFDMEAALAVVASDELSHDEASDSISSLVTKSLLTVAPSRPEARYRLLETTRTYACEKLEDSGELPAMRRAHAQYMLETFASVALMWEVDDSPRCQHCNELLEDLREALRWSLSSKGESALGIDLTIAALPFWLHHSLVVECLGNATRALALVQLENPQQYERKVMKLEAARGKALLYTGATVETLQAFRHAFDISRHLEEPEYQALATWGLWAHGYLNGPYPQNLQIAEDFMQLAQHSPDAKDIVVGKRMLALSNLCLGRLDEAHASLLDMLRHYPDELRRRHILRYAYDQKVAALCALAYTLWLEGFSDQAIRVTHEAEQRAETTNHLASQWHVLTMSTCPIALLTGGISALAIPSQRLLDARNWHHPGARAIGAGQFWGGEFWRGLYRLWRGETSAYETIIIPALEQLGQIRYASYLSPYTSALCTELARHGRREEALRVIDTALTQATANDDRASLPELIRCQGDLLLDEPGGAEAGEQSLHTALTMARQQGMKAWELRITTSLARLWIRQGKHDQAQRELSALMDTFSEGFGSVDFEAARQLLKSLP